MTQKHRSRLYTVWKQENNVDVLDDLAIAVARCKSQIENALEVQAPREKELERQAVISIDSTCIYGGLCSQDYAIKLVENSMPRRYQAIINNGGDWITY